MTRALPISMPPAQSGMVTAAAGMLAQSQQIAARIGSDNARMTANFAWRQTKVAAKRFKIFQMMDQG
jgi:hypothetical protein